MNSKQIIRVKNSKKAIAIKKLELINYIYSEIENRFTSKLRKY